MKNNFTKDKVYCHTGFIVNENITFTKGKYYKIESSGLKLIDKMLIDRISLSLKCDHIQFHISFSPEVFNKYFDTIKQLRNKKLKRLWKNQII